MVINKKLFRNGRSNTLRFIGSMLIIAMCVCMYVSFTSSMWSLYYNVDDFRKNSNAHDYLMGVSNEIADEEKLEEDFDCELEKRYYCELTGKDDDIVRLMSANSQINKYVIIEGEDIEDADDLLIDSHYAEKNGYSIGSEIVLGGETFKIKGFYIEPDFMLVTNSTKSISVNHSSYGIAIASKERLSGLPQSSIEYMICCDTDRFDRDEFFKAVGASAMIEQFISSDSDNRATYIDNDLVIYTKGMQIIPFFFMIVACFVVAVILSKLLKAETVEIGIFYAFGYRQRDIFGHYIFYPIIISLAGSLSGIGLGMLVAPVLRGIVTERYSVPAFSITLELKTVLTSLLIPFVFLTSICSVFILMKLRQSPLTLLKNQTSAKSKAVFRNLKFGKMSFVNRFRIREILRNIPKYLFMIFGVCLASTMLLLYATILGSMNKMMDDNFKNVIKYEYMYTFSSMQNGTPEGYRTNMTYLTLDDKETAVKGIDVNNKHLCYEDTDGSPVTFEDHIITIGLANKHDISVGDTVTLKSRYSDDEYGIKIDRIIISYSEDFVGMPLDEFNEMFDFPEDSYISLTSDKELDIDSDNILLRDSRKNVRESIDETLKPLRYIMISMMIMAAFVAFVLMTIIISIILEDSGFTISLMKILGYKNKRISKMIIDFNRYVVIIAFALSVPMTLSITSGIMNVLSDMMGMYIPAYIKPTNAVIGFILLYLNFVLVKLIMKRRILAIDPSETLKSGE